ncbi:hypothetical protein GGD41_005041 [Paraburkholderia bryophila]|uniref:Uncharacterized protein n=1 Tax=Paraburkholderia bryophila TaxID=420952 RepID=A0A7Y9WD81_9BURK|nr:hypothetical protein [Paraburkholderia bryophila]
MSRENAPSSERAGRTRGGFGAGLDQIGDGFGLRQVELVVEESAAREFARLRETQAERAAGLDAALQHELQHDRTAVALQFDHVFAGVRMRRRKVERDAAVEHVAAAVEERHVARVTRCKRLTGERLHQRLSRRFSRAAERDPHDADAASTGRGGNGDNGIGIGGEHGGLAKNGGGRAARLGVAWTDAARGIVTRAFASVDDAWLPAKAARRIDRFTPLTGIYLK